MYEDGDLLDFDRGWHADVRVRVGPDAPWFHRGEVAWAEVLLGFLAVVVARDQAVVEDRRGVSA